MTKALHDRRARTLRRLAAACGALAAGMVLLTLASGGDGLPERKGEPVFPGLSHRFEDISRVEITLPDDSYTLVDGEDGWGLAEFDFYPITGEALSALFDGMSRLSYDAPRTADPEKYGRIGVGDPETGGLGARVKLLGAGDTVLVDTIIGRRGTRNYVRNADEARAWRVDGDLPPFYARAEWVDLDFLRVDQAEIREVRVEGSGGSYTLRREGERFVPTGDGERLVSRFAAVGPALTLSRWAPIAVKRMDDPRMLEPVAGHTSGLTEGRIVALEVVRDPAGELWVTVTGKGDNAEDIAARSRGWLFRLPPQDIADLTTPRDAVIRNPE
jgi:hypothetical protein